MSVGVNRETSLSRRAPSNKSEPAVASLGSGQVGKSRVQSGLSQGRDVESPLCARTVPSAFAAPLMPAMRSGRMLPRVLSPPPRELSREPSKRDPASARGKMDSGPLCAKMPPSNNPPPPPPPPPMALPKDARSWFRMALPAKVEKSCCPLPVAAEVSSCSQLPALMGKIPAPLWGKMEPSNIPPPPPPPPAQRVGEHRRELAADGAVEDAVLRQLQTRAPERCQDLGPVRRLDPDGSRQRSREGLKQFRPVGRVQ